YSGIAGKLAAVLVLKPLKKFKKKMDYTEYGGAPLMGIAQPVIKAHGSSNPKAFMNAIRQARNFVQQEVIADIRAGLDKINLEHPAE
ncbi:MAG TPA: phosphate--acyl-ACP acyltransferase, partial [Firmicutes bacterium]|nr:phosphate--acyl-ACP acyltransferase [Bacillota bacterium]